MLLSQREFLENYTSSPKVTEDVLRLFCDTFPLNLDEEGDRNAQLGNLDIIFYVTDFGVICFCEYPVLNSQNFWKNCFSSGYTVKFLPLAL